MCHRQNAQGIAVNTKNDGKRKATERKTPTPLIQRFAHIRCAAEKIHDTADFEQ
jgi:hypothetical protein